MRRPRVEFFNHRYVFSIMFSIHHGCAPWCAGAGGRVTVCRAAHARGSRRSQPNEIPFDSRLKPEIYAKKNSKKHAPARERNCKVQIQRAFSVRCRSCEVNSRRPAPRNWRVHMHRIYGASVPTTRPRATPTGPTLYHKLRSGPWPPDNIRVYARGLQRTRTAVNGAGVRGPSDRARTHAHERAHGARCVSVRRLFFAMYSSTVSPLEAAAFSSARWLLVAMAFARM